MIAEKAPAGRVFQLNRKPETAGERGLPKFPEAGLTVTVDGVAGDFNRWRTEERAGERTYALLIVPLETLEQLQRDGWPVQPGDLGENVTTVGVPYDAFSPPSRFRIGTVVAETSKACTPCIQLYHLRYVGREKGPAFLKATLGRRGWYARVVEPGVIRTGDAVAFVSNGGSARAAPSATLRSAKSG